MDVRYQVFVSSTFEDLRAERQQVIQAILELGHIPVGMELFPASDDSSWGVIERAIAESDYYVVIVAGRYGSTDLAGLSFTEREFDFACEQGIPILGFIRDKLDELPAKASELDQEKRDRLAGFYSKVQERACRKWQTADELGLQVLKSLNSEIRLRPRIGWVRADRAKSVEDFQAMETLRKQIEQLSREVEEKEAEIERLDRELRDTVLPGDDIAPELLAAGEDRFSLLVSYGQGKEAAQQTASLTWDEIFLAIAPRMYGYLLRRANYYRTFDFEEDLADVVRAKIFDDVGRRKLSFSAGQIDAILFQFKQRGLLRFAENEETDFRGWTLTASGEAELTRLIVKKKA
ncbi:MAG: DUF4062 domain-containing protein [Caulobacteraceae bacterium]